METKKENGNATDVGAFMRSLEHPLKAEVEALRQIILNANEQIREEIKWNAPSFAIQEHFATFNLHSKETVQIIFHRGAKVKDNSRTIEIDDPQGLLRWLAKDRCVARFSVMSEVREKGPALAEIVTQWIRQI